MAGKPFAIIGVNSDRNREKLKEVVEEKAITWRSFWNEGSTRGPISTAWKVSGWPTLYLLDGEGKIRHKGLRGPALDRAIEKLMAEAGHEVDLSEHTDPLEEKLKKEEERKKKEEEEKDKDDDSDDEDDKGDKGE